VKACSVLLEGAVADEKDRQRQPRRSDDELFVDPIVRSLGAGPGSKRAQTPAPMLSAGNRPADKRRLRGEAPKAKAPHDTKTSLTQARRQTPPPEKIAAPPPPALLMSAGELTCLKGPEQGAKFALHPGTLTIGRARENSWVLRDVACSRRHLQLEVDAGRIVATDLDSGNGTLINGRKMRTATVVHGDTIEIGSTLLIVHEAGRSLEETDRGRDMDREAAKKRVMAVADKLAADVADGGRNDDLSTHGQYTRRISVDEARAVAAAADKKAVMPSRATLDAMWGDAGTNSSSLVDVANSPATSLSHHRRRPPPSLAPLAVDDLKELAEARVRLRSQVPSPRAMQRPLPPEKSKVPAILGALLLFTVVVGAVVWFLFFKDADDRPTRRPAGAAVAPVEPQQDAAEQILQAAKDAERRRQDDLAADYAKAMQRAEDAAKAGDWPTVAASASTALQLRPNDPIADTYARRAAAELEKPKVEPVVVTPVAPPVVRPPPVVAEPVVPKGKKPPIKKAERAPVERIERAPPSPPPKPKPAKKNSKEMSEPDARDAFTRAIEALRTNDLEDGCALLDRVADRAPSSSPWRGKAEALYLKRCGR
jgi:pSer/pThr/pTyr-binding forkhead associated (FHA) protein